MISSSSLNPEKQAALTLFIALTQHDESPITQQVHNHHLINICMEQLRDHNEAHKLSLLQLLVNISRDEVGAKHLMQEDSQVSGLYMSRLFTWFVSTNSSKQHEYDYIAHLLL